MLKNIVNYVRNNEFYINIWKNKINIVNFKEIVIMEDEKIVIMADVGKVIIRGRNLSINKLLENELLIMGVFCSIELGE
ncbi:MAG: YabP/YqfC family sporulation protein [Bacilli bacterium]|nr:YabP/YqfC family sporulation protein [Bacilli bacterium]